MFPEEWSKGMRCPFLEDLFNYDIVWDWVHASAQKRNQAEPEKHRVARAVKDQKSTTINKAGQTPLVGFGKTPEDHFLTARSRPAAGKDPCEAKSTVSHDLEYAVKWTAKRHGRLKDKRQEVSAWFKELKSRTECLRPWFEEVMGSFVKKVAEKMNIGLMAVCVCVCLADGVARYDVTQKVRPRLPSGGRIGRHRHMEASVGRKAHVEK